MRRWWWIDRDLGPAELYTNRVTLRCGECPYQVVRLEGILQHHRDWHTELISEMALRNQTVLWENERIRREHPGEPVLVNIFVNRRVPRLFNGLVD